LNLAIVIVGSLVLRALGVPYGEDETQREDYEVDAREPSVRPLPPAPGQQPAATT
jgi:hypothetical protein